MAYRKLFSKLFKIMGLRTTMAFMSVFFLLLSGCGHAEKEKTEQKPTYSIETAREPPGLFLPPNPSG